MADSPSHKWENGVLTERAVETNRWKVLPDGTPVDSETTDEKPVKKAVTASKAENKSVKADETK